MALVATLTAALRAIAPRAVEASATLQERQRTGQRALVNFATGVPLIIAQDSPTLRQYFPNFGQLPWEVVNGPNSYIVVHDAFQTTPASRMLRRGDVIVRSSGFALSVNETYDDGAETLAQLAWCTPLDEKADAASVPPRR